MWDGKRTTGLSRTCGGLNKGSLSAFASLPTPPVSMAQSDLAVSEKQGYFPRECSKERSKEHSKYPFSIREVQGHQTKSRPLFFFRRLAFYTAIQMRYG